MADSVSPPTTPPMTEQEQEHAKAREEALYARTEAGIRADERRRVAKRLQGLLNVIAPFVGVKYFQVAGLVLASDEAADNLKRKIEADASSPPVVFSATGNLSVAGFIASIVKAACGGALKAIPNEAKKALQGWRIELDEPVRAKGYVDTLPADPNAKGKPPPKK